jgi:hypothetical protein
MLIEAQALKDMAAYQNEHPSTCWAAYQNQALDSSCAGQLQFLAVGPDNTYKEPPEIYPVDNHLGMGWRYKFAGWVDLAAGIVRKTRNPHTFWGTDDEERLTATDPHDAIEALLENADLSLLDWQVTVFEYAPKKLDLNEVASYALDSVLEWLDEHWGDPDVASNPTPSMKQAAEVFAKALLAEYEVWECELTGNKITVSAKEWIAEHCPEWLEDKK